MSYTSRLSKEKKIRSLKHQISNLRILIEEQRYLPNNQKVVRLLVADLIELAHQLKKEER